MMLEDGAEETLSAAQQRWGGPLANPMGIIHFDIKPPNSKF
jgi:hypothetical protein